MYGWMYVCMCVCVCVGVSASPPGWYSSEGFRYGTVLGGVGIHIGTRRCRYTHRSRRCRYTHIILDTYRKQKQHITILDDYLGVLM